MAKYLRRSFRRKKEVRFMGKSIFIEKLRDGAIEYKDFFVNILSMSSLLEYISTF